MQIVYRKQFTKHLKERIKPFPSLYNEFKESLSLFISSPEDPSLNDHQLTGEKSQFRSFSVTNDIRITYHKGKNNLYLIDIGSHDQVY